jgi:hypothetical protein
LRRAGEAERISGPKAKKHAAKQSSGGEGAGQAQNNTDRHERHTLAEHEPQHAGSCRTEGHAKSDLAFALRHRVCEHAVQTDAGQAQGEKAESGQQPDAHAGHE